jgi:lipoic acid synthetase
MRLPEWLIKKPLRGTHVHEIKKGLRKHGLHTVCEEARCPNLSECFSRKTAAFMIMGNVCTRSCKFCAVANGKPLPLDPDEPSRVARQARELGLKHVVVTSVTRDDLRDGGARFFADTIREIRALMPKSTIEVLTPDFGGREFDIKTVCDAGPDIFNHNVETVRRLTPEVRNKASYERSLEVLRTARHCEEAESRRSNPAGLPRCARNDIIIKSGFMVGLGETEDEVAATLHDLKEAGCDIITIGQYLRPSKSVLPVSRYVRPEEFDKYKKIGEELGVKYMFCGPFVRSSYRAEEAMK